jgi:hypothetical protein
MTIRREELFRKLYHRLNGEGFRLCKCTKCGYGPMNIKGDASSEQCDNCGLIAWRDLKEEEFLFETELLDYLASHADELLAIDEVKDVPGHETRSHEELQELKRDFDNFADSMKATQMELLRRIEHNNRPAAAYDPDIAQQLGESLYSQLHERTQHALRLSEYQFNINQEPDGFSAAVLTMAQGYENELNVSVIGPIVMELLNAGTETYDAQGKATSPLIRRGKYSEGTLTLGNLGWYLRSDPAMRDRVSKRGFDVEAISRDVAAVGALRNKPAHDFSCDRALAEALRRRILCPDGALCRLHPAAEPRPHIG